MSYAEFIETLNANLTDNAKQFITRDLRYVYLLAKRTTVFIAIKEVEKWAAKPESPERTTHFKNLIATFGVKQSAN